MGSIINIGKSGYNRRIKRKTLKSAMRERLKQTFKGWLIWHGIVKKYGLKKIEHHKTAVVLIPCDDMENCYFALLYIERMLKLRELEKVIILTQKDVIIKAAKIMCPSLLGAELLSEDQSAALTQYYDTRLFDPRFIHASLTEPFGRNGRALVGVKGITTEEAVAIGVYKIIPYVRKRRPAYAGADQDLQAFFSLGGHYTEQRTTDKIR